MPMTPPFRPASAKQAPPQRDLGAESREEHADLIGEGTSAARERPLNFGMGIEGGGESRDATSADFEEGEPTAR